MCVCRTVGPAPAHPTLTAAACRVWSAAFPEGNAEDEEGKRGSLQLRSLCSRHREPAVDIETERDGDTERQMDKERERRAAAFRTVPLLSNVQLHTSRGQKWE